MHEYAHIIGSFNHILEETPMLILIAGPYRSGTGDNPELMAENLSRLEGVALPLFRAGHVPVIGEWLALPLLRQAGSRSPGDAAYDEIAYPVAHRLLRHCEGVLRLPGVSKGADEDVRRAGELGIPVYYRLEDIPAGAAA
jgi:hypothetical protein